MSMEARFQIEQTAATVAAVMGIDAPRGAQPPIAPVVEAAAAQLGANADRVLLYNPDAIAAWLWPKYPWALADVAARAPLRVPVRTVMPSVTPVCFASMYSGVSPALHGIQAYVKPVLTVDTLFDVAPRAGKRVALVATNGDSMAKIFLERAIDYFFYDRFEDCLSKGLALIEANQHDLIAVYNRSYDATMHKFGPESREALDALASNARSFAQYVEVMARAWRGHDAMFAFAPDHGCHEIDGPLGSHGLDMAEDMHILHCYGFMKRRL